MAELRHSSSIGSRVTASPRKRDDVVASSSPLVPDSAPNVGDDDDDYRGRYPRDRFRSFFSSHLQPLFPFFFSDESRSHPHKFKISLFLLVVVILSLVVLISSVVHRLVRLHFIDLKIHTYAYVSHPNLLTGSSFLLCSSLDISMLSKDFVILISSKLL